MGTTAAPTARLVEHTTDLIEVATAVTTTWQAAIGPAQLARPDQASPAATVVAGPARPIIGPVHVPNVFKRMMDVRDASFEASGEGGSLELADHERERAAKKKKPAAQMRGPAKVRTSPEPAVKAAERLRQFPGNSLKDQSGKLYCACSKSVLSNTKGSIQTHVDSPTHKLKIQKWAHQGVICPN